MKPRLRLLGLLLLNYFTFALVTNIIGVLLPVWKSDFKLSGSIISLLGSAFFLAYGITSLPQGILLDKIGNKKMFLWGMGLVLFGSIAFALFPVFAVGLVSLFVIGIGVTALQLVGNLLVKKIDDDIQKYSRNLTLTQLFCGIGGATGGFLIKYLTDTETLNWEWKSVYFIFAGLSLLASILIWCTNIPESKDEVDYNRPSNSDYFALLKNPQMLLFAFGIFIYVGIEVGIASLISSYLFGKFEYDPIKKGAEIVSTYWIFQSIGRFTGGFVLNYLETPKALILYSVGAIVALITAVLIPNLTVSCICFIAIGFFTSIMFPSIFSTAVNSFSKSQEATVAGILCTSIAGGAFLTPLMSLIGEKSTLGNGLLIVGGLSFAYIAFIGFKALSAKKSTNNVKVLKVDSELSEKSLLEA